MKSLFLIIASTLALFVSNVRRSSLCTANAGGAPSAPTAEDFASLQAQLAEQRLELEGLRAAKPAALEVPHATSLLIKGAGVEATDVNWRIRAGLSPAQAVEVASNQVLEEKRLKEEVAKKKTRN